MKNKINKVLALCLVLVMCIPAFSGMNVSGEKGNKEESTPAVMELPDLENWRYKIPIIVDAGNYNRTDCVLSQTINITKEIGGFGTFDENSIRVIETLEDGIPKYEAVSQCRWINNDVLDVTWIMNGTTPANTKRHYSIYFDILENGPKNTTTYPEHVTTKENSQQIWVYGTDYEIKIDKDRGGSRELKIKNVPRKGYTLDKDWMSWCTQHINWGIKGANTTLVENGPIYKTVKITSSDSSQTIYWYFYPSKMKIITQEIYEDVSFDTIADNLNNKDGTLVWGDGTTENLTKDYKEYSKVTDFFYVLDPGLNSSNDDDVKGRCGFWADTVDDRNQTLINAGEKGTRWTLGGSSAWFGFEKNDVIRDVVLSSQNPPEIIRAKTTVKMENPTITKKVMLENQVIFVEGDLTIKYDGNLILTKIDLTVDGNVIVKNATLQVFNSMETVKTQSVYIIDGSLVTLSHSKWAMASNEDGSIGIYIGSWDDWTGEFDVEYSTITAFYGDLDGTHYDPHYYKFEVYGKLVMTDSSVDWLWADPYGNLWEEGGIRLYSYDNKISGCNIHNSQGCGIFCLQDGPEISNNRISDCVSGIFIDPLSDNENEDGNNNVPPDQDNSTNSSNVVEAVNITYYDGYMEILFSDGSSMVVPYQPVEYNSTNLILNGDFSDDLNDWTKWGGSRYGSWSDEVVYDSGNYPHVLEYQVWNSWNDGSGTGVYQPLNIDVSQYSSIYLECEVKVISNTLTDSGWWSYYYGGEGEMPGHVWIYYKDFNDENWCWSHGFLPCQDRWHRENINLDVVVRNQWYPYQSPNLVNVDTTTTNPYNQVITGHKMKTITGIYVGGNGWDFKGRFANVQLLGTEIAVNQPPVAVISEYQIIAEYGDTLTLDGSNSYDPDGYIVKYSWDLDAMDGITQEDKVGSIIEVSTESEAMYGIYFVTLTVTDDKGATGISYVRVVVWFPDWWTIEGNTITDCDYGIYLINRAAVNIVDCTIYNNYYGIYCDDAYPTIVRSYIFGNDKSLRIFRPIWIVEASYDRRTVELEYDQIGEDGDEWDGGEELYMYGFSPYHDDTENENEDFDEDGYTNIYEAETFGTDPLNSDTDSDGLNDKEEVGTYMTNAFYSDTDNDGWADGEEVNTYSTDPLEPNPFPYWGFTWHLNWGWIGSYSIGKYEQGKYHVDNEFQQIWDHYFKPTHGRTIRLDVNVMTSVKGDYSGLTSKGEKTLNRLTHLCLWAKENGAYIYAVLGETGDWDMCWQWVWIGYTWIYIYAPDPNCHKDTWYINKVEVFIKELATTICDIDPEAYKRIVAYQVENEMNHDIAYMWGPFVTNGHHDNWAENWEINLMAGGSEAIRDAEIDADVLTYCDRYTPLAINPSYDWICWNYLPGDRYNKLKSYIKSVLDDSRSKIDIIGLDYYPGTWVTGVTEEDVKTQVESLCNDFGLQSSYGKCILVTETGFSTHDRPHDHQKNYYQTLTSHLTTYYYTEDGKESGFVGVLWYELFSTDSEWWVPHEDYFGVMIASTHAGSVPPTQIKSVWYWLRDEIQPK